MRNLKNLPIYICKFYLNVVPFEDTDISFKLYLTKLFMLTVKLHRSVDNTSFSVNLSYGFIIIFVVYMYVPVVKTKQALRDKTKLRHLII